MPAQRFILSRSRLRAPRQVLRAWAYTAGAIVAAGMPLTGSALAQDEITGPNRTRTPTSAAHASTGEFLLVRRTPIADPQAFAGGTVQPIRLAAVTDHHVEHIAANRPVERIALSECVALLNPNASLKPRTTGLLVLSDGQRLPGEPIFGGTAAADSLAWSHPWLGRIDVPLQQVDSVLLTPAAQPPQPGTFDTVLLANGDRQEGFIVSIGDPVSLEVERGGTREVVDIPLKLIAAIAMISPRQPSSGRRIWFDDNTVIDVTSLTIGDDGYVRLGGFGLAGGTQPTRVNLTQIAAILLDPAAMIPLATLTPVRIEGPATRYIVPAPQAIEPNAPLNLSRLKYSGPLTVRYTLPEGSQRFAAEATLPPDCRTWGDYELVVRSNDTEVFRATLNGANPVAAFSVALSGRELTIELTPGAHGAIQDQLILTRAMLLQGH